MNRNLSPKHVEYWRRNLKVTGVLLLVWFFVTFVCGWYARELNELSFIGPLGYYIGAQGAMIVYVLIVWYYERFMNRLDRECGVQEEDD